MISRCRCWLSLHLKMRSKRIHFTVTWTTMHCSGFEVNDKPRDLFSALFFYKKKKKTGRLSFSFTRKRVFPQTSAYFASSFSLTLIRFTGLEWVYFSQLLYLFSNILAFFLVTKFLVFCVFLAKINQICGRNEAIGKNIKIFINTIHIQMQYTFKFK